MLLTSAYGLVNANSKWQAMSDELLLAIGFEPPRLMPPLFINRSQNHMIALAAKIVDDILVTGLEYVIPDIIH